jgi:hypothetical protein
MGIRHREVSPVAGNGSDAGAQRGPRDIAHAIVQVARRPMIRIAITSQYAALTSIPTTAVV